MINEFSFSWWWQGMGASLCDSNKVPWLGMDWLLEERHCYHWLLVLICGYLGGGCILWAGFLLLAA